MAVSLKGTLIIRNNNTDDSFQLMYVNRQMASCCLLDHDNSSCVRKTYKSDLMMSVVYSKLEPCLPWGLLLTAFVGACFGCCDLYCKHAPATLPLPVHMYGPALCIGLCRYIPLD